MGCFYEKCRLYALYITLAEKERLRRKSGDVRKDQSTLSTFIRLVVPEMPRGRPAVMTTISPVWI